MLKLFARTDGEAVDRRMMAETLFRAAFDALDHLPDEQKQGIARRVHAGSYDRMAGNEPPSNSVGDEADYTPSNTRVLKSPRPKPPR